MNLKSLLWRLCFLIGIVVWIFIIYKYEVVRLFATLIPPLLFILLSKNVKIRNTAITIFVILWMVIFHYESTRYFYYKEPIAEQLPKTKFLFPPIGWIMFYNVDDAVGFVQVYGINDNESQPLDPHEIFRTRTIGYDNIHRGILGTASYRNNAYRFCQFLNHRFDDFDTFAVTSVYFPERSKQPYDRIQRVLYQCPEK